MRQQYLTAYWNTDRDAFFLSFCVTSKDEHINHLICINIYSETFNKTTVIRDQPPMKDHDLQ